MAAASGTDILSLTGGPGRPSFPLRRRQMVGIPGSHPHGGSSLIVTNPWKHQREAADFALRRPHGAMLCVPMGGGKSLSALMVAAGNDARSIIILCPVSVIGVWRREFARHAPGAFTVICPTGTVKEKAGQINAQIHSAKMLGRRFAVAVNYESAWRHPLCAVLQSLHWDLLILEESHRIKSPSGKASRYAGYLSRFCRYRLALTGTPAPHSPLDLWGQARAVDPSVFGSNYFAFRGRYAVTDPVFPSKVRRWINQDELRAKFAGLAYECDLTGVLDVPEATDQTITVKLGAKARKVYDQLETGMWAKLDQGEINAANGLVQLLRLQQLTSGYVPDDAGDIVEVDTAKFTVLVDLLQDVAADVPVVVFARFLHDLEAVEAAAAATKRTYGEISGRRKDLTPDAEMPKGVGLMGVQIQSGGVGIDLTRAGVAVYFSLGMSLGDYLQSRARLHRPGQKRRVNFLHLIAEGTIDEKVMAALERKQEVVEAVLFGRRKQGVAA